MAPRLAEPEPDRTVLGEGDTEGHVHENLQANVQQGHEAQSDAHPNQPAHRHTLHGDPRAHHATDQLPEHAERGDTEGVQHEDQPHAHREVATLLAPVAQRPAPPHDGHQTAHVHEAAQQQRLTHTQSHPIRAHAMLRHALTHHSMHLDRATLAHGHRRHHDQDEAPTEDPDAQVEGQRHVQDQHDHQQARPQQEARTHGQPRHTGKLGTQPQALQTNLALHDAQHAVQDPHRHESHHAPAQTRITPHDAPTGERSMGRGPETRRPRSRAI